MFALLLIAAFLLLVVSPVIITAFLYRLLRRKGWQKTAFVFPVLLAAYCYLWYDALYPSNNFYKDEFAKIMQAPELKDAKAISKSASYPDIHGDYAACVTVELPGDKFDDVLNRVRKDSAFSVVTNESNIIGTEELQNVLSSIKNKNYLARYQGDKLEHYRSHGAYVMVAFLDDHKTILLYRASS